LIILLACFFHRLGDGDRHFAGLALAHADTAIVIADHGEGGEAENPATLHHLGDAVDGDHLLLQAIALLFLLLYGSRHDVPRLKLQTVFACRLGQSLDTTVEGEAGTIERNLLHSHLLRLFSDTLADQLGGVHVATVLDLFAQFLFGAGRGGQHHAAGGIDKLRIDVRIAAMHAETDRAKLRDFGAGFARPAQTPDFLVHCIRSRLFLLGLFDDHDFIGITHTLALVGLGLAVGAHVSRHLTNTFCLSMPLIRISV
jgi:hypothetical protein